MNIHQDFKELLELLTGFEVDYMIIGGYAVAFHGHPRFTKDLGIFLTMHPKTSKESSRPWKNSGFPEKALLALPLPMGIRL